MHQSKATDHHTYSNLSETANSTEFNALLMLADAALLSNSRLDSEDEMANEYAAKAKSKKRTVFDLNTTGVGG